MGLLDGMIGGLQGPLGTIRTGFQQNPYAMMALGMGLMSGNGTADAFGRGLQGLLAGAQMDMTAADRAKAAKELEAQKAALNAYFGQTTPAWKPGGMPGQPRKYPQPMQALAAAFPTQAVSALFASQAGGKTTDTDDIREFNFAKQQGYTGSFTDFLNVKRTGSGSTKTSLNPIWGEDDQGNAALGQLTDQGSLTRTALPPGFKPSRGVDKVDAGTEWLLYDKQTGQLVGKQPKDLAGASAQTDIGKQNAADLGEVNSNAKKAVAQKNTLSVMRSLATDPKFYSGAFSEQVAAFKKIAIALGGDPDQVASMENFQSLSNELVRQRLGSLGTGVSNADVGFISRTVPTLDMSPNGVSGLLDILEKMANRDIEVANLAKDYAANKSKNKGALDAGWVTYLARWAEANPLFPDVKPPSVVRQPQAPGALPPGVRPYTDFIR